MAAALVECRNQRQGEPSGDQPGGAKNEDEFPEQQVYPAALRTTVP